MERTASYGLVKKLFAFFHDTPIYKPLLDICENFESPVKSCTVKKKQAFFPEKVYIPVMCGQIYVCRH